MTMEIKGRNLIEGVPKTITIDDSEIRESLGESISTIIMNAIQRRLSNGRPPELSARYQRPRHRAHRRRRAHQESRQAHSRGNRASRIDSRRSAGQRSSGHGQNAQRLPFAAQDQDRLKHFFRRCIGRVERTGENTVIERDVLEGVQRRPDRADAQGVSRHTPKFRSHGILFQPLQERPGAHRGACGATSGSGRPGQASGSRRRRPAQRKPDAPHSCGHRHASRANSARYRPLVSLGLVRLF